MRHRRRGKVGKQRRSGHKRQRNRDKNINAFRRSRGGIRV